MVVKEILAGDDPGNFALIKPSLRAKQSGDGAQQSDAQNSEQDAADHGNVNNERKDPVCLFLVPFTKGLGNQGAAAGAKHEAKGAEDHQKWHNEIDCGKGGLSHIVGHEEPVYNSIDRGEHQHTDRWQCQAQELFKVKMVR